MRYTYEELNKIVDDWYDSLTDEQHYRMSTDPSPIFEEWVLSVSQMKENDVVDIDYDNYEFEILNNE